MTRKFDFTSRNYFLGEKRFWEVEEEGGEVEEEEEVEEEGGCYFLPLI